MSLGVVLGGIADVAGEERGGYLFPDLVRENRHGEEEKTLQACFLGHITGAKCKFQCMT